MNNLRIVLGSIIIFVYALLGIIILFWGLIWFANLLLWLSGLLPWPQS